MSCSPPWPILFGIETEVGISVVEEPEADVVEESIQLVRAAAQYGLSDMWDYATEDPHVDARGFRVRELRQDEDEAHFFNRDAQRAYTFQEIKSDLVLRNGARFYNDHAHPEYCTPECATLGDLIAQDKAGERILAECARQITHHTNRTVRLYKNNTDFRGHSYGCHDNFLIPRRTPWERLVEGMTPFLVTRQLYAGAGKVGWEREDEAIGGGYQISQRADFFTELVSIDTMNRRPLINTRDEPHADSTQWRRFHIIIGDANMSEFATWLKIGTTALVLEALSEQALPSHLRLVDPLDAHRTISRDTSYRWEVTLPGRRTGTAVQLQRDIAAWVATRADTTHPEKRAVLDAWNETLDALEADPLRLDDRLDWVAKRQLLDRFREAEGLHWSDPWMQSLDLEYHLLDPDAGLYEGLAAAGAMKRMTTEEAIRRAVSEPPSHTRAALRGLCVSKFAKHLKAAHWDHLILSNGTEDFRLDLAHLMTPASVSDALARLKTSQALEDIAKI